jgi:serpin B
LVVTDTGARVTYVGFSLRLFREVARQQPDSNIFLSPASAAWALAMTAGGAANATWRDMATVLGVDVAAPETLGPANAAELSSLAGQSGVQLNIANSIWASEGRPFLPAFLDGTRRWYGAQVTSMRLHGPAAAARINAWVSGATKGRIPAIVPDTLADTTAIVLLNAVYFHGQWRTTFDSARTKSRPFVTRDGSVVSRLRMANHMRLPYMRDSGFQALRLPYRGGRLAMYVFLPDSGRGLSAFTAKLDSAHWVRWMHEFQDVGYVDVELPKFRLEYGASLVDPLKALGMGVAFDSVHADFGRMLPRAFLRDSNAFISDVLQKTFVDVNEQGTEAAAATSVTGALTVLAVEQPIRFIVDRPFCVAIRDDRTGLILFLGQITDPVIVQ